MAAVEDRSLRVAVAEPEGGDVSGGGELQRKRVKSLAHAADREQRSPDWWGEQASRNRMIPGPRGNDGVRRWQPGSVQA
jgi:hypothetical protein